nr:MAG TPA: ECF RNA polymerase sigma factor-anti-sigma complex, zinc binding motif.6A [Caudoviricetes sp.]
MKEKIVYMEVTSETIRDYNISPEQIQWRYLGNHRAQAVAIRVTEKVYAAIMRPMWSEQKQEARTKYQCIYKGDKKVCNQDCDHCTQLVFRESCIDFMEEDVLISEPLETTYIKKLLIETLIIEVNKLAPMDQLLLKLIGEAVSEREIARIMGGRSKTAIHKRKEKLFVMLRKKLENTVTIKPHSVCTLVKGGKQNVS